MTGARRAGRLIMTPSFHHRPRVGGELTDSYETARVNTPPPTPRRWKHDRQLPQRRRSCRSWIHRHRVGGVRLSVAGSVGQTNIAHVS